MPVGKGLNSVKTKRSSLQSFGFWFFFPVLQLLITIFCYLTIQVQ